MTVLYQNLAIRQLESQAYEHKIATPYDLMQRAGEAAWFFCQSRYPDATHFTIFCGKGNNAGDGLVFARLAALAGMEVQVCLVLGAQLATPSARHALTACEDTDVTFIEDSSGLQEGTLIVDALLGSGIKGEVTGQLAELITVINQQSASVLSLDVPSGLDIDSGCVHGSAIKADATISFIGYKTGFYMGKGPEYSGHVAVNNLGLPQSLYDAVEPTAYKISWLQIAPLLQRRQRDAHKGDHGHTLVIGGDYGMGGAVRMAAEAALRVGAGLVSVATRPEHVPIVSGARPEIMCHQVAEPSDLDPLLERCNVVVIGPGLGQTDWAKGLLARVLAANTLKVIDADALNLLSQAPQPVPSAILTPHPGEAARLLGDTTAEVQADRFSSLGKLIEHYEAVVVLKGVGTLLGARGRLPAICTAGNPGMATAGMGDVLTGIIGGLMAQGLSLYQAAEAGVFIHATAADIAARDGGERGLLASDVLDYLRELVNPNDSL